MPSAESLPRRVPLIELLKARYPQRSEQELRARVIRGEVLAAGEPVIKPGALVAADVPVEVRSGPPFVSRGGEKLDAALRAWRIDCGGAPWIDAGCSTGGFTDCLLQHGAALVYAVDVGVGQLDWRLRTDPRVKAMEGTNILHVMRPSLDPPPIRAVADLSFRSLQGVARHILGLTSEGRGIFLVKPQFELRRPPEGFRGVVKDRGAAVDIAQDLLRRLAAEGVTAEKAMPSPISGRKGNTEFLLLLRLDEPAAAGPAGPPVADLRALLEAALLE
jgi:23S rRNA (cytidine1920-2'-O)/16S rRNA (cytidine1409-2'-O)-methyltransferase